jgi:small-conductance mechanosensitive channel
LKHIIDELKRKTKEAKSRIDWSEINNKKESIIDEVKQLKHDFDENQRKKKEDQLYQKDFEFKELENEEKRIEKPKRSIIDTCTTKVKEAYNEAIKEAKE